MSGIKKVSVILVNYNGRKWLPGCFDALARQTYPCIEIILVDNGSTDESVLFIQQMYPATVIVQSDRNRGFAGGNNLGVQYATGEIIVLLNTDTRVSARLIEDMIPAFDERPLLGVLQPKMLYMHDTTKLDSCGSFFSWTGFLSHIGNQAIATDSRYNRAFPVFSVKGACMAFRRDLLQKTGGLFDEDYWSYFEETDFCIRVWLAGYECWYDPRSVLEHAMGGTSGLLIQNDRVLYHSFKNRIMTYCKTLSLSRLLIVLGVNSILSAIVTLVLLCVGQLKSAWAIPHAWWYCIINFISILRKRRRVQHGVRRIPDKMFLPRLTRDTGMMEALRRIFYLVVYERYKRRVVPSPSVNR